MRRVYLDNAATSFPKPPAVSAAMLRFMENIGAPGRGVYAEAREAAGLIRRCRERINRLINGENPDHVIFTLNTSDALNLALQGVLTPLLRSADRARRIHLVTTVMEHNSILRPANALKERFPRLEWTRVDVDPATGIADAADIIAAIRPGETALVVVNHASNVSGSIQPIAEVGRACREADALFLVDAAQSLGHLPVDVRAMHIDLLAFPGHKGLLGPQGTGGLYIRPGVEDRVETTRQGGTGNVSEEQSHPRMMPERYEAGSHNAVGIVGLSEGVQWLLDQGIERVRAHELALMTPLLRAAEGGEFPGLRLLGPLDPAQRVGVLSFVHDDFDAAEIAAILEAEFGILCRAGLHCAPLAHAAFGTAPPAGRGAVRLSFGPFNTEADSALAIEALRAVCGAGRPAHAGAK